MQHRRRITWYVSFRSRTKFRRKKNRVPTDQRNGGGGESENFPVSESKMILSLDLGTSTLRQRKG